MLSTSITDRTMCPDAADLRKWYSQPIYNFCGSLSDPGRPEVSRFCGQFGGPIWKDKLFFFASYEGVRLHNNVTVRDAKLETPQFEQYVIQNNPGKHRGPIFNTPGIAPHLDHNCDDRLLLVDPRLWLGSLVSARNWDRSSRWQWAGRHSGLGSF